MKDHSLVSWPVFEPWLIDGLEPDVAVLSIVGLRQFEDTAVLGMRLRTRDWENSGRVLVAKFFSVSWICSFPEWDVPFGAEVQAARERTGVKDGSPMCFFQAPIVDIPAAIFERAIGHPFAMAYPTEQYRWFRILSDHLSFDVISHTQPILRVLDAPCEGQDAVLRRGLLDLLFEADENWH